MGALARSEVSQAKQAFLLRDMALAEDLVRQDEEINQLNKECFHRAVEIGTDPDVREWAMTMMLVARAMERIGDNAVDVGEQVAFVVSGLVPGIQRRIAPLACDQAVTGASSGRRAVVSSRAR